MRLSAFCLILGALIGAAFGAPLFEVKPGSAEAELETIFPRLGLAKKSKKTVGLTDWEKSKFDPISKRRIALKSTYPSGLGRDHFYRFTIDIESFPDSAAARRRVDSLMVIPPKLRPEEDKAFPLRRGFTRGREAIVVRTDVFAYDAKLEQLTRALELGLREMDTKRRRRLLDSLFVNLRKPTE